MKYDILWNGLNIDVFSLCLFIFKGNDRIFLDISFQLHIKAGLLWQCVMSVCSEHRTRRCMKCIHSDGYMAVARWFVKGENKVEGSVSAGSASPVSASAPRWSGRQVDWRAGMMILGGKSLAQKKSLTSCGISVFLSWWPRAVIHQRKHCNHITFIFLFKVLKSFSSILRWKGDFLYISLIYL